MKEKKHINEGNLLSLFPHLKRIVQIHQLRNKAKNALSLAIPISPKMVVQKYEKKGNKSKFGEKFVFWVQKRKKHIIQ